MAAEWLTAGVALAGIAATAVTAALGLRHAARLHRDQLADQERQLRESAERDHFQRLWERRQASYLELVVWALRVRRAIREFQDPAEWAAPASVELETLSQVLVYADHEVFARSELLRGRFEQFAENLAKLSGQLPTEQWRRMLDNIDDEAWQLIGIVRDLALRLPDWREPIPLHENPHAEPREPA